MKIILERCKEKSGGCVPLFIGEYPGCSKEEYELERKEHLESLERAKNDNLDIEMNDCCLRGFGTIEERKFYRKKWKEAHQAFIASGHNEGYPEWWETTGYTKEEIDDMMTPAIIDSRL